jgi:hypothetical protein
MPVLKALLEDPNMAWQPKSSYCPRSFGVILLGTDFFTAQQKETRVPAGQLMLLSNKQVPGLCRMKPRQSAPISACFLEYP